MMLRQVRRVTRERSTALPRTEIIVLETGQELPEEVRARMGPRDLLLIQEVPPGYLTGGS
jgi:hypothetical protein